MPFTTKICHKILQKYAMDSSPKFSRKKLFANSHVRKKLFAYNCPLKKIACIISKLVHPPPPLPPPLVNIKRSSPSFPGVDHKCFVCETAVKPYPCSSKAESFKIHGHRHMLVIVSTYGESRLNESMADHKPGKTFCFKPNLYGVF